MAALRHGQGAFTVSPLAPAGFAKLALSLPLVYKPKLLYPFCAVCQDGEFPFFAAFFFVMTHSPVLAHWPQPQQPTVPSFGSWSLEQSHPVPPMIIASATQPYQTIPDQTRSYCAVGTHCISISYPVSLKESQGERKPLWKTGEIAENSVERLWKTGSAADEAVAVWRRLAAGCVE